MGSYTPPPAAGGAAEGDFTAYAAIFDNDVAGSTSSFAKLTLLSNLGITLTHDVASFVSIISKTGVLTVEEASANLTSDERNTLAQSSLGGKYQIFIALTGELLHIYKDGVFLESLSIPTTKFANLEGCSCAISPDGKYVCVIGRNTGNTAKYLMLFEGS